MIHLVAVMVLLAGGLIALALPKKRRFRLLIGTGLISWMLLVGKIISEYL